MDIEGQIKWASATGLGFSLMENYAFEKGTPIITGYLTYHVPTSLDVPLIKAQVVENHDPTGFFGAKGGGQSCLGVPAAAALANAVWAAVGVRIRELP